MKTKPLNELEQDVETYVTQKCGVSFEVFFTGEQVRDDWQCDGWRFCLKKGKQVESFEYFTGTGHRETVRGFVAAGMPGAKRVNGHWQAQRQQKPALVGLLHSIVLDSGAARQTFAEWCADFGYDTDSRKALATYEACQICAEKLGRMLTHAQIVHIAEMLQDY